MGSLVTEEAQIQAEELGKGDVGSETQKWWCELGRTSFCTGRGRQRRRPDNTLVLGGALVSGEESRGCGTDALPAPSPLRQALSLFTPRILTQWEAGRGVLGSRWGETRKDCGVSPQVRGRVLTPHGSSQPLGNLCVPLFSSSVLQATAGAQTPQPKVTFQVSVLPYEFPAHRVL